MPGVNDVPDQAKLYAQGVALGAASHDQRAWHERLADQWPPEVCVAAGVLAMMATNEQFATVLAFELYNAGCLTMPEVLPSWEDVDPWKEAR